jgi:hypothetical protein
MPRKQGHLYFLPFISFSFSFFFFFFFVLSLDLVLFGGIDGAEGIAVEADEAQEDGRARRPQVCLEARLEAAALRSNLSGEW